MLKYGDYFSRKTLYTYGISPDRNLDIKEDVNYVGESRKEQITCDMRGIYQSFFKPNARKDDVLFSQGEMDKLANSIVHAFYDVGILSNDERDYYKQNFATLTKDAFDRERISVNEADVVFADVNKTERVAPQIKSPEKGNVRQ